MHLYKAMRKYGAEKFTVELIEECDDSIWQDREKYWIEQYRSYDRKFGYNMTKGGEGFDSETASKNKKAWWDSDQSIEYRKALSQQWKDNNPGIGQIAWNKGLTDYLSDESRELMSRNNKASWDSIPGRREAQGVRTKKNWENGVYDNRPPMTEKQKQQISDFHTGRKRPDYTREKMSLAAKGKPKSEAHRESIRQNKLNQPKITCMHCNKTIAQSVHTRHHGDKCKLNPDKLNEVISDK